MFFVYNNQFLAHFFQSSYLQLKYLTSLLDRNKHKFNKFFLNYNRSQKQDWQLTMLTLLLTFIKRLYLE